jgi:hypothetical protein
MKTIESEVDISEQVARDANTEDVAPKSALELLKKNSSCIGEEQEKDIIGCHSSHDTRNTNF